MEQALSAGEHIDGVVRLRGGWTSEMRRLDISGPGGRRSMVLRSFVKPFFLRHAEGLLSREADILRLLGDTDVPAATLVGVDATAQHCDHPSLLMSLLPGSVRLGDEGADRRSDLPAVAGRLGLRPDAEKVAVPWRELDRTDLIPTVLTSRLEGYVQALLDRY
ncbi:phosphotransferase [Streptomyces flaveus]|uniref:Aminoglycoside phosphotransferase domain-containing protein n=1 Tax=Streptomyces flaveus TaxID=66370 RepID=A0A917QEQ5_9ACTN|nr:phosphotransferase [Streptomyces flaveus]GGK47156.1 hypothetical protein GCM10010094_03970 [Streptomyces flaveus]